MTSTVSVRTSHRPARATPARHRHTAGGSVRAANNPLRRGNRRRTKRPIRAEVDIDRPAGPCIIHHEGPTSTCIEYDS